MSIENKISKNELVDQITTNRLLRMGNLVKAIDSNPTTYKSEHRVLRDIYHLLVRAQLGLSVSGKTYNLDCENRRLWVEFDNIKREVAENVNDYLIHNGYKTDLISYVENIMKDKLSCFLPWRWFMKKHKTVTVVQGFWVEW